MKYAKQAAVALGISIAGLGAGGTAWAGPDWPSWNCVPGATTTTTACLPVGTTTLPPTTTTLPSTTTTAVKPTTTTTRPKPTTTTTSPTPTTTVMPTTTTTKPVPVTTPSSPPTTTTLAFTGVNAGAVSGVGGALVLGGAGFVLLSRRRRR